MKNSLKNLLLIICSISLLFLILEITSRIVIEDFPIYKIASLDKREKSDKVSQKTKKIFVDPNEYFINKARRFLVNNEDPSLMALQKNIRVRIKKHNISNKDTEIYINSLGLRHPEISDNDIKGKKIVLVLGDSTTFNGYLNFNETYTNYLQEKLSDDYLVLNAGVPSIDLANEFAIFYKLLSSITPDIVIVGAYLNDSLASPRVKIEKLLPSPWNYSYFLNYLQKRFTLFKYKYSKRMPHLNPLEPSSLNKLKKELLLKYSLNLKERNDKDNKFMWDIYDNLYDYGMAWSSLFWKNNLPYVDLFKELTDHIGGKLIFTLFPIKNQIEMKLTNTDPHDRFEKELKEREITYVNILKPLKVNYNKHQNSLFYDHCHLRPAGNNIVATSIADVIKRY